MADTSRQLIPAARAMKTVQTLIEDMRPQFRRALGRIISDDRFARICLTEVRKNPALQKCSPESLAGAFMTAAQLNLEPGINCYLISFKKEAQFVPGYRGLVDLMWRSNRVKSVWAEVVHKGDDFSYALGTDPFLRHIPGGEKDPDKITHSWALVETIAGSHDSGRMFKVMTREEIELVRDRSPSGGKSPLWVMHYPEACKKTVLIRLAKIAPVSPEVRLVTELDDLAETGQSQHLGDTIDVTPAKAEEEPEKPPVICEECGRAAEDGHKEGCSEPDFGACHICGSKDGHDPDCTAPPDWEKS